MYKSWLIIFSINLTPHLALIIAISVKIAISVHCYFCLAPVQHHQCCKTSRNHSFYFQQKHSSMKQPIFSKFIHLIPVLAVTTDPLLPLAFDLSLSNKNSSLTRPGHATIILQLVLQFFLLPHHIIYKQKFLPKLKSLSCCCCCCCLPGPFREMGAWRKTMVPQKPGNSPGSGPEVVQRQKVVKE